MSAIITVIHIIICAILIVAVLLQSGKAADLAGAFGGGGSQTAFGPRGTASLMSKITTISAIMFMLTSLGLWILSDRGGSSVVRDVDATKQDVPAATDVKKDAATEAAPQKTEEKKPAEQPPQQQNPPAPKKEAVPEKKG